MTKRNSKRTRSKLNAVRNASGADGCRRKISGHLSGIKRMHKRGSICDAQMAAAERFRTIWEWASSDGLKAIDYCRERVDGRSWNTLGVADRRLWARQGLARIYQALGKREFAVLAMAVGNERSLEDVRALLRCRKIEASNIVKGALKNLSMIGAAKGSGYGIRSDAVTN